MRRRILVVDDEPGMQRAVRRILERSYEVACAASPVEALEIAEGFLPDLAILDIRLPGCDGFELMGLLKSKHPDLDVILMTGSINESDRKLVRAIRHKAFYYIEKPFDREVLQTLVERCLELRRLGEENRRQVRWLEGVLAEARAFQASMLPPAEASFGDVSLAARFLSCDTLCGDLYDYAVGPRGSVSFLVADVSGHGASAAMLTGIVKSAFRSCTLERYEPRSVVERIAAGIRTFNANRFVTLFAARIDAQEGCLDYVNAGHPPALLWGGGDRHERLAPTGPLISPAFDDAEWEQERRPFASGDRLLLYTDGLTEAPGGTDQYGLERLCETVRTVPEGGPGLLEAIARDVQEFMQGRRPPDDMTLLTVVLDGEG